jgi:hypothetical protein
VISAQLTSRFFKALFVYQQLIAELVGQQLRALAVV